MMSVACSPFRVNCHFSIKHLLTRLINKTWRIQTSIEETAVKIYRLQVFQLTFRKINVLTTRCSDHSHSSLWKSLFYTSPSKKLINPKLYLAANSSHGLTRTAVPKCTSCKKFRKQIFANQKWRSMIHKSFQQLLLKAVPRSATPREILYILCMYHLCGYWTKLFKTQKCDLRCLETVCFII